MKLLEIEDLRRALSAREDDLERVEAEKRRIASERGDVDRDVAALEADLRRVKREAEAYRARIEALKNEVGDNWLQVLSQSQFAGKSPSPKLAPTVKAEAAR